MRYVAYQYMTPNLYIQPGDQSKGSFHRALGMQYSRRLRQFAHQVPTAPSVCQRLTFLALQTGSLDSYASHKSSHHWRPVCIQ